MAPAHLDHVCPFITRIGLLDRLGATGEYVFEETPVRSTTQEVLAHGHKGSKIGDGIGIEMVELHPKEIQKPSEENTRRQRKTTVYVSG